MKKKIRIILIALLMICLVYSNEKTEVKSGQGSFIRIESGFKTIPDSMQMSVYWYWISDHISEEGVVKDLYAMKKAGINRAFIGNIGLSEVPYGRVKMFSEEWWRILHTALKTATQLNIQIGLFNSPGWSQSGGPWVKPENAMRYLDFSEQIVRGPKRISQKLEKPNQEFQDVKIIAYPAPKDYKLLLNTTNGSVSSSPVISDIEKIVDGNNKSGVILPTGGDLVINFQCQHPFTARSLSVRSTEFPLYATALFQAEDYKGAYTTLSEFEINRTNPATNVGFTPYAPVVISFPSTTSSNFRLIIKSASPNSGLAEVEISSSPRVERYSEKTLAKMYPTPLPYWKEYQWSMQPEVEDKSLVVDASKIIDITKNFSADGTLHWDVPSGDWVILRTGMVPTGSFNAPCPPELTGAETDKMSRKHIETHFNNYIGEVLRRIPEADRRTLKVVVADSYETGGQNFTDDFLTAFKERYGYDATPYLPVYKGIVVNSQLCSDRFLWDMRRLVADKVAYDYVGGLRDVSHKYGLTIWLENYGHWGFPGEFLMYGGQSDEIGGEFWSEGDLGNIENRAATSCGHIYGKNKISAESNTCGGAAYSRYPATIKQRSDRFFAEGINNTLLHVYIAQPYEDKTPGINAGFGNEFNRKNTWFSQLDVYTEYLKRTNLMLQQGLNVADVAYFIGEDAPKMTGITDPALPTGYQFDYINAEVIEKYMTVRDGLLTLLHGTQYRILVLPYLETMRPELLKKIQQLVNDGGVVLGPSPKRSPSLQNQPEADVQVQKMSEELWGDVDGVSQKYRKVNKGMIMSGMSMQEAFDIINCLPDCKLPEDNCIHYGHRTLLEGEIYFLTNQTNQEKIISPEFRVEGLQPELWEATSGSVRPLSGFTVKGDVTEVPLKLAPFESVFVVFRKPSEIAQKDTAQMNDGIKNRGLDVNYPLPTLSIDIKTPWTLKFDTLQRGPAEQITFTELRDLSTSDDQRIKYYSGTVFYENKFFLKRILAGEKVVIDLGDVTAMAKVTVNGRYAGGVWTAPYQVDITKLVKKGKNEIKIEVVNTWVNRLIGDLNLPVDQRKTWSPIIPYTSESPLQRSGLFGPVRVLSLRYSNSK